jgi:hypothetical protein
MPLDEAKTPFSNFWGQLHPAVVDTAVTKTASLFEVLHSKIREGSHCLFSRELKFFSAQSTALSKLPVAEWVLDQEATLSPVEYWCDRHG